MFNNFQKKLMYVSMFVCICSLLFTLDYSYSIQEPRKTILTLHQFEYASFNGGQTIVFSGKLTTDSGDRVPYAEILIKNDGPCPEDKVIAEGKTDKHGRFLISTVTKIWDESDNLIKVHAEFEGNSDFLASKSYERVVVVYPLNAEKCLK